MIGGPDGSKWVHEHGVGWSCRERDGTRWVISGRASGDRTWALTMTYREHRLVSTHRTMAEAERHQADMMAMWAARSMATYVQPRIV